jgi:uncharacterized protein
MSTVVPPVGHLDDRYFWEGTARGELLVQRCSCGHLRFPPAPQCPECSSAHFEVIAVSGRGTIYAWIISHHPTKNDESPRVVVLVALDEGVRMVSNLVECELDEVANDLVVEVCFMPEENFTLPQFRLAEAGATARRPAT